MLAMTAGFIWNWATKGLDLTKGKVILLAAFIALPSRANAWSFWSGSDSYAECLDYYIKNPDDTPMPKPSYRHLTPEQTCLSVKLEEDRKRSEQAEVNRVLILGCRAESITEAQFEACVALVTGERH